MSPPLIVAFTAFLVCCAIALRFIHWRKRVFRWSEKLLREKVDATPTKFSEWVSFAGLLLTIVGIAIGWVTFNLQNRKANLESRTKELNDRIASLQQELQSVSLKHKEPATPIDIHLVAPIGDVGLVGNRATFEWKYIKHTELSSYLIEVVNRNHPWLPSNPTPTDSGVCDFSTYQTCRFFAENPESQEAELGMPVSNENEGDYLWRVVPAKKNIVSSANRIENNNISDWSEYGSFSFYNSLSSRIAKTQSVLVGTTYSVNARFSALNADGYSGYDIDLIRLVIEGCLTTAESNGTAHQQVAITLANISFDGSSCSKAVEAYRANGHVAKATDEKGKLQVKFKSFPSVSEGLEAVSRKEIDVFIGSVTKALGRENDALLFTDGYCSFDSELFAHSTKDEELDDWLKVDRRIAVIDKSTNHWLATLLAGESKFSEKVTVVAFPSFSAVRGAFDRREVDGVLVDGVLSRDLHSTPHPDPVKSIGQDVYRVLGLDKTAAWRTFHSRLGSTREEFAIAVAREGASTTPRPPIIDFVNEKLNIDLVRFDEAKPQTDLYGPIQLALHSYQIFGAGPLLERRNNLQEVCHLSDLAQR